ncbi:mRNA interferase RelE/StbE [Persephonella hydrogeniphila]|uniref:mRNA interferase RelE/StbE n=1 Tax=Persephonella hydrogeniphila TaxID=198703 RepID=A0A285NBZ2_9AQUI|nr:type II toxin-antitoxin system RelE/ParE family toxin [Persephonella hydrogeniphila]SNZ06960.1 mRNA interferase RelE/StbE [Persephonella hydrogeniphila]
MYELLISEVAEENLKKFPIDERVFIAERLKYLAENFDILKRTKKVKSLQGYEKYYRFVISRKIRAIFEVENDKLIILILRIGKRKNIYKNLNLE